MKNRGGFAWWELAVILLVTGFLAGITIPKFRNFIVRSKEAATKGGLASLRSAVNVYYRDNGNVYPTDTLQSLTKDRKYIPEIPLVQLPGTGHPDSNVVRPAQKISDEGGWIYYNDRTSLADWGRVVINCSHYDSKKEIVWSEL